MNKKISYILSRWEESLGLRLSVFIMGITMVLFAMTIGVCLYVANDTTTKRTISYTESQMDDALEFINDNLLDVEKTVKCYASVAQNYTTTKDGCYRLCEDIVRVDTTILAATMMVRHDYYPNMSAGHHLFAPAIAHERGSNVYEPRDLVAGGDDDFQYEKTDSNWIWTNKLDAGYWCEPYQDIYHTQNFLVTYSYPLHDKEGKIYAVLCADVSLSWLAERLNQFRPTEHTKVMMMSQNSHLLVHPIPQFVEPKGDDIIGPDIAKAVRRQGVDTTIVRLYERMMSGSNGIMDVNNPAYFSLLGCTDTIPESYILYSKINTSGWPVIAVCPKSDIEAESNVLVNRLLLSSLLGLVLMAIALFYMVRKMVRPYKRFAAVDADIKTAERIQSSMISTVFPMDTMLMGKELFASMKPAKSIGGDLYDYHLDGEKLTIIVGDVSGKGMPAAFFMSSALTLFRVFANKDMTPAQIVSEINKALSTDNDTMMFITMFVARLNLRTGELLFCNAGHNAPVVVHDNIASFIQMETNLPVGIMDGMPFVEEQTKLVSGDRFVIYTDGVTEAEDVDGNLYSDNRLLSFLSHKKFTSARQLCTSLAENVAMHAGEAEQSDDITMMCVLF